MTIYSQDHIQITMLERFEGLTSAIDCNGDDGQLSLTFRNKEAYLYALKVWSHVNDNADTKFVAIANHDGCGPDKERQSYYVTGIKPDESTLKVILLAKPTDWGTVAQTYDVTWGQRLIVEQPAIIRRDDDGDSPPPKSRRRRRFEGMRPRRESRALQRRTSHRLEARGWFGDIIDAVGDAVSDVVDAVGSVVEDIIGAGVDVAEKAVDAAAQSFGTFVEAAKDTILTIGEVVTGKLDVTKSMDFPFNIREENQRSNIYTGANGRLKLDCIDCFIAGSFKVTGRVAVQWLSITEFSIAAIPRNVKAALVFEAQANTLDTDRIDESKELFSAPVPGIGIAVPGIFKLGGVIVYEVGFSAVLTGNAIVDFGLKASLPDDSLAMVNLANPSRSVAKGWKPVIEPVFEVKELKASLAISAYSQPKLFFGVEIISAARADVALTFRLPELESRFTPKYDRNGACEGSNSQTGIDIEGNVKVSLNGEAEAGVLGWTADYRKELLSYSWNVFDKCIPFNLDIPSLGGSGSTGSTTQALSFAELPSEEGKAFRFPRLQATGGWDKAHLTKGIIPIGYPVRAGAQGLQLPQNVKDLIEEGKKKNETIKFPNGGVKFGGIGEAPIVKKPTHDDDDEGGKGDDDGKEGKGGKGEGGSAPTPKPTPTPTPATSDIR